MDGKLRSIARMFMPMCRQDYSAPTLRVPPIPRRERSRQARRSQPLATLGMLLVSCSLVRPVAAGTNNPAQLFVGAVNKLAASFALPTNGSAPVFSTTIKFRKAAGIPDPVAFKELEFVSQAPDHLRLTARADRDKVVVCRDGQQLSFYLPDQKFALIGETNTPLFGAAPELKDATPMGPLKLGLPPEQLVMLPLLADLEELAGESVGGERCNVIKVTMKPEAVESLKLPRGTLQLWLRESDTFPLRLAYREGSSVDVDLEFVHPQFRPADSGGDWKVHPREGDRVETVARAHLTRFVSVTVASLGDKIPSLGPVTGERRVVGREGQGRLEIVDGTKVLYLKGTPEEMGQQHGTLLRKDIRNLVDRILYQVGVASSFEKGRWVLGEIEAAQKRLHQFMDARYYREMDALAAAAHLGREEVRLANFFPELFHCSGFSLFGKATGDGHMYHGRILDYLRGLGLEQNAVVMVFQPDQGNAWVNIGYAGFVGSVTAMNEKHISIGEMGGRGEGNWDGKPMAELVREVMEKANTLDEAVEIMRKSPRTCEYYYVISDAKSQRAVGIAATPTSFQTVTPGQNFPQLPHPVPDAVLMSAGDRYEELVRRVQAGYGRIDAAAARDLMRRPVCMNSNIHCALFEPDTLDFWVANADSQNVAAHARFTHYNLAELLQPELAH